jgi:hypothetical protein
MLFDILNPANKAAEVTKSGSGPLTKNGKSDKQELPAVAIKLSEKRVKRLLKQSVQTYKSKNKAKIFRK